MHELREASPTDETDARRFRRAMCVRRWFLILAVPVVLFLTLYSVLQWQRWWRLLTP
ncbi:MAG: hypothetical protein ACE5KM_06960 [Planctomycetaceae bacterium]